MWRGAHADAPVLPHDITTQVLSLQISLIAPTIAYCKMTSSLPITAMEDLHISHPASINVHPDLQSPSDAVEPSQADEAPDGVLAHGKPVPDGKQVPLPMSRANFNFRKSLVPFALPLSKFSQMKGSKGKRLFVSVMVVRPILKPDPNAAGRVERETERQDEEEDPKDRREAVGIVIRKKSTSTSAATLEGNVDVQAEHEPQDLKGNDYQWELPKMECQFGKDQTILSAVQRCAKEQLNLDVSLIQSFIGVKNETHGTAPNETKALCFDFLVKVHPTDFSDLSDAAVGVRGEGSEGGGGNDAVRSDIDAKAKIALPKIKLREGWEMKWASQAELWKVLSRGGRKLGVSKQEIQAVQTSQGRGRIAPADAGVTESKAHGQGSGHIIPADLAIGKVVDKGQISDTELTPPLSPIGHAGL